ncbi:MAG: thiamine pyrophosphate-binding protein [Actinobacteria bacterium]|nr:thiamine pyrophosphate-binding protein [Actinomycetota bacterium]
MTQRSCSTASGSTPDQGSAPAGGSAPAPGSALAGGSAAALLAGYVHAAGVRHVFGYPGESVIDFMEAARHHGIEVVSAVREGTAAFMAEAAAMATGLPGVCLSTLGPGSTAVLNGVASATLDRVPMLAVSGQIESSREQYFTHQVVDHDRMFAPVTKLTLRLDAPSADTVIRKALRTATAERPGAVHLTVTADTWCAPAGPVPGSAPPSGAIPAGAIPAGTIPARPGGALAAPPLAAAAGSVDVYGDGDPLRVLRAARRPVILAGIAALRCAAGAELVRLAELAGIPVVVSPMAKGTFPEDHAYFAGVLDMAGHRVVWDLLAGADLILAAGFDPVELISPWSVSTPVLHLDTTPNTDQVYASAHELVGNVAAILGWISAQWSGQPRWAEAAVAAHRARLHAAWTEGHAAGRLNPSDVVAIAREATPPGTIMTTDVGSHKLMAGQVWRATGPRSVLMTNGLSAMGFGVPAAIAAKLARPDRPVIALVGDGGFAMTATEMRIAAALGLPVTVVVFADGSLNRIELRQQLMGYPATATRMAGTDLAALAAAMDCDGVRVDTAAGLEKALTGFAGRSRPLVVEAQVDTSQYEAQF